MSYLGHGKVPFRNEHHLVPVNGGFMASTPKRFKPQAYQLIPKKFNLNPVKMNPTIIEVPVLNLRLTLYTRITATGKGFHLRQSGHSRIPGKGGQQGSVGPAQF